MANFNFNQVILGGRLCADPELKTTPNGVYVTQVSIAVSMRDNTDFFTVVAWRQTAEFLAKYFRKGSSVCVVGSLQTRKYEDKSGAKRTATEIVAREVSFVDSKSESPQRDEQKPGDNVKLEPIDTDEELPF